LSRRPALAHLVRRECLPSEEGRLRDGKPDRAADQGGDQHERDERAKRRAPANRMSSPMAMSSTGHMRQSVSHTSHDNSPILLSNKITPALMKMSGQTKPPRLREYLALA